MSDSEDSDAKAPIEVVFVAESRVSSVELPMEEWSSLEMSMADDNIKRQLYNQGLYDPGSGEICAQYIAMSASSVLRHPYYTYPPILDPGIEVALLAPERQILYPQDGQDLYLATCKEMNQCPVRSFYKGLLQNQINLQYYCIDPKGFRAMAKALQYNNNVEVLNLTDNFLNDDACYHMGDMLLTNKTLTELNLRGCRIGSQGARRLFYNLHLNKTLKVLDLSYNKLGDEGMEHLAKSVRRGLSVERLNLSYNKISGDGVALLVEPFETHNNLTHLNLSWNKISTGAGGLAFLKMLSESTCLEFLNLAWNALADSRFGKVLKYILLCPLFKELNLSNNMLKAEAITNMLGTIAKANKLTTLNMSYNPMTPDDAYNILTKVAMVTCKVRTLLLDNVDVTQEFLFLLANAKRLKSKKSLVVTYGNVIGTFKAKGPDPREVVLNRIEFVTKKGKKTKLDIALFALQLAKDKVEIINTKDLTYAFRREGVLLDEDLIEELAITFLTGPKNAKVKTLDVNLLVEYVKRKWPERQLPATPPPEPEPEPVPQKTAKTAKKEKGIKKK